MAQIYKVTKGFSEGFFTGFSEETKRSMLSRSGITFVYSSDFSRTVFFDPMVHTPESKEIERQKEILEPISYSDFKKAFNECYMAIGLYNKEPRQKKRLY